MQTPFLIGTKVYLRPLEREDAPTIQPWVNDPELTRNLLLFRPMSRQAEEDYVARVNADEHSVATLIATRDGDRPVGLCSLKGIDLRNRNAELGILVAPKDEWGKGYGTEATRLIVGYGFDTLNLHRVYLKVVEENERALRSYLRVGFRKEGVLRDEMYKGGRYLSTVVMSILRPDWGANEQEGTNATLREFE